MGTLKTSQQMFKTLLKNEELLSIEKLEGF